MSKDKITSLLDFVQEQNEEGKHKNWLIQRALNLLKAKDGGNKFLVSSKVDLTALKDATDKEKPEAARAIILDYLQSIIDLADKCDMSTDKVLDEVKSIRRGLKEEEKNK
jgi:hypothetical protein